MTRFGKLSTATVALKDYADYETDSIWDRVDGKQVIIFPDADIDPENDDRYREVTVFFPGFYDHLLFVFSDELENIQHDQVEIPCSVTVGTGPFGERLECGKPSDSIEQGHGRIWFRCEEHKS